MTTVPGKGLSGIYVLYKIEFSNEIKEPIKLQQTGCVNIDSYLCKKIREVRRQCLLFRVGLTL